MAGIRRTWDKELFEQKAKERSERGDDEVDKNGKTAKQSREEFKAAASDAAGPMGSSRAFLKAREQQVELDSKVGKVEIITVTNDEPARGAGFWCEVCSCLLKDSASYLDHINGKKHQRALGFSMRVERADVSSVKNRLNELKRKAAVSQSTVGRASAVEEYEQRISQQEAERDAAKKRRKEQAESRKQSAAAAEEEDGDDDAIKAMLGFGGFGSSKK